MDDIPFWICCGLCVIDIFFHFLPTWSWGIILVVFLYKEIQWAVERGVEKAFKKRNQ